MQAVSLDSPTSVEVLEHVLRFSRCFYDSFRFKRNRVRQWRFILLILEKETADADGRIRYNFSAAEISRVLGWDEEDVATWRKLLVKQFRDKGGEFLQTVGTEDALENTQSGHRTAGRPPQTKIFKLSPHFESSATQYARGVITNVMRTPIDSVLLDQTLSQKGPLVFRQILSVLKSHYYAAWLAFMDELKLSKSAREEVGNHSPYWVITLVAYREYCFNPQQAFTADEFYTDTRQALRVANKEEVSGCITFLVKTGLLREAGSAPIKSYTLADVCIGPMGKYTGALKAARDQLEQLLSRELR